MALIRDLAILAAVAAIIAAAAAAEPLDDRAHEHADGDCHPVFSGDVSVWGGRVHDEKEITR